MKLLLSAIIVALGCAAPAFGQSAGKTVPRHWSDAVGRLNIANKNMCTGTLISDELVLTAAHCMFDPVTGDPIKPNQIEFLAGLNGNTAVAIRQVSSTYVHPEYIYGEAGGPAVGSDIAIVRLKTPIKASRIVPISIDKRPNRGDSVGVVSYTQNNANTQMFEDPCYVISRKNETVVLSCKADFGASGAPVFMVRRNGVPQLISVVSAKAKLGGRNVSIGTTLDEKFENLKRIAG